MAWFEPEELGFIDKVSKDDWTISEFFTLPHTFGWSLEDFIRTPSRLHLDFLNTSFKFL
jgi:hypothetical protein